MTFSTVKFAVCICGMELLFSSSITDTSLSSASAILSIRSRERFCVPFSMRQMLERWVPIRFASCSCDNPFSSLACVSFCTTLCLAVNSSFSVHDNVIIYDNIVMRFGYLSKSLGFFSGSSSPSSGSPPTISVITLMRRKFVAHLHPVGVFAPNQECTY